MITINTNNENKEILLSFVVKNHKGEDVTIEVPKDYKGECNDKMYICTIMYSNLFHRIDSIYEVIAMYEDKNIESVHDSYCEQIYCEDYEEDENGEWREMDDEEWWQEVLKEFKKYGCLYRLITHEYSKYDDKEVRFLTENQEVCKKGAEQFSAKYKVGTKAFYHKNDSMTLKASKINEIVIRHKAGYNPTTEYVMTDGNSVTENNVLMKDKALEWVEQNG